MMSRTGCSERLNIYASLCEEMIRAYVCLDSLLKLQIKETVFRCYARQSVPRVWRFHCVCNDSIS
jgi:hypothetical protein